jgi:CheY-like chemotaxis protein
MSKKLLLADDSITIRKVVGIIFTNEDYSLLMVDNGDEALVKARQFKPDLVLADVLMPGKTGYEVCEELRRDPDFKDTPLLLLTGAFEPFDEEKAKECGADDFLSKPFESHQLLEKVNKLIDLGNERKTALAMQKVQEVIPEPVVPVAPPVEAFAVEPVAAFAPRVEELGDEAFLLEELSSSEEIIEALPEDDLWGSFESVEPAIKPVELETSVHKEFAELEAMDLKSLGAEEEKTAVFEPPQEAAVEPAVETFTLGEEAETASFEMAPEEEFFDLTPDEAPETLEPAAGDVFVLGEESKMETIPAEPELQFAPEEEYVPVVPPAPHIHEPPVAAEPLVERPCVAGEPTLSEEQLAEAIGKISRELIEKIAWEVVPDLAEILIREEIRKLKESLKQ